MKKYLISFAAIFCTLCSQARGFQPEMRVVYEPGIDQDKSLSLGAEFIAGYRVAPIFRIGCGVGVSYVDLLFESAGKHYLAGYSYYSDEYRESAVSIPVFVNAKVNFTHSKVSPFFDLNVGYNSYIACSEYAKKNTLGFFGAPSFGVDFNVGKGAITAQMGYKYQERSCEYLNYSRGNYSQMTFSLGYQF